MVKKRPSKIKQPPAMLPFLAVEDVERASKFYQEAFDFKLCDTIRDENGVMQHADLKYNDVFLMIASTRSFKEEVQTPKQSEKTSPMMLYLYCKKVDEFYKHAIAHGATSIEEPTDQAWEDRVCRLQDLDGYIWYVASWVK